MVASAPEFKVLPEMQDIADDTDDIFDPSTCQSGIATVRRGRIKARDSRVVDVVAAFHPDAELAGIYIAIREPEGQWRVTTGSSDPHPSIVKAVTHVIGVCPMLFE
jgi:hypothetical protein